MFWKCYDVMNNHLLKLINVEILLLTSMQQQISLNMIRSNIDNLVSFMTVMNAV